MEHLEIREMKSVADRAALYDLRGRILRPGRPPEACRFSDDDALTTLHLGAFLGGKCLGIASLYATTDGLQLRGMAVEPATQGQGVGAALVRRCQQVAAEQGQNLWCNARETAVGFYERLGWVIDGERFHMPDVGPHLIMRWHRNT